MFEPVGSVLALDLGSGPLLILEVRGLVAVTLNTACLSSSRFQLFGMSQALHIGQQLTGVRRRAKHSVKRGGDIIDGDRDGL